jgi:hypothetical protein
LGRRPDSWRRIPKWDRGARNDETLGALV